MSWKVRHEGSPQSVEVPEPADIVRGLQDGLWEPTDEVMGPENTHWVALENHPAFAEVVLDLEPPPPRLQEDETRLDMNALIDVCLVLLIFFILTTSYAALQKMLDLPSITSNKDQGPPKVTQERVDRTMIKVEVQMENRTENGIKGSAAVVKVEGQEVAVIKVDAEPGKPGPLVSPTSRLALVQALARYKKASDKTEILLNYSPSVPNGIVVAIEDAGRQVEIAHVHILVPEGEMKR